MPTDQSQPFDLKSHVKYFMKCLDVLSAPYSSLDTNRLTVAYFCVSGLDMLGAVDKVEKKRVVEWIYALQVRRISACTPVCRVDLAHRTRQVLPPASDETLPPGRCGGFRGGGYMGGPFEPAGSASSSEYDEGHLAMAYTALAVLLILGDDLSRVNRAGTLDFVRSLQLPSGCFCAYTGGESDMRFLYCATAICTMLRDEEWRGVDVGAATHYVLSAQNFDGGLGLGSGQESHGGSIYTGLAALALMGTLPQLPRRDVLVGWIAQRQVGGYQGRPNKDEDTCYSFWFGAALALLGAPGLTDLPSLSKFAMTCECPGFGGLAKCAGNHPDVLHSYYALCGLSIAGMRPLQPIDCRLGISARAAVAAGLGSPDVCLVAEPDEEEAALEVAAAAP